MSTDRNCGELQPLISLQHPVSYQHSPPPKRMASGEEKGPSSVPGAIIQLSHRKGCSGLRLLCLFVVQEQSIPFYEAHTLSHHWGPGFCAFDLQINKLRLAAKGFLCCCFLLSGLSLDCC